MQHGGNRKLKALAAALAVAAVAAPATQASIDTDARHQALVDKAQQTQVDPRHQALLRHGEQGPAVYVTGPAQPVTSSSGMDWSDAGIGAGAAIGLLLIAGVGARVGRKKLVSA